MSWTQPPLPFDEPVTMLPRDGRARIIFAWRGPEGKLNCQRAVEVDQVQIYRNMLKGGADVYETQWWMDRPRRCHAFAYAGTHAFVDVDTYKVSGLERERPEAIARSVLRHCDATDLPPPSAILSSGRGLYLKWCFGQIVGREDVGSMIALNRALMGALKPFGADPAATDVARLLRVTGSINAKNDRQVEVIHLEQSDGRTITYDAHSLAQAVVPQAAEPPETATLLPAPSRQDRSARTTGFTREGWLWAIVEDVRSLAAMRWGGQVPEGRRDIFAFVIACQLVRIFPPTQAWTEIVAIVSTIVDPNFVRRELAGACSTAMRLAREAWVGGEWVRTYRYGKQSLIGLLEVAPSEMRHMRALIDDNERKRRNAERERARRAAAGAIDRATWRADAADRAATAQMLRAEGRSWQEVADAMELASAGAARAMAIRAKTYGSVR